MQTKLPTHDIILLGIGHTNAHVLRMWRMKPIPDARLTCVSDHALAAYSGMLPGVLAGQYPTERMEIDLVRLCAAAGARLIVDSFSDLDVPNRKLLFAHRPPLPFDVLSIGIGSVPSTPPISFLSSSSPGRVLAIKPMQTFLRRLSDQLARFKQDHDGRPLRVVVAGGGAGGVEITFCLPARVRAVLGDVPLELTLVQAADVILPGMRGRSMALAKQVLADRSVRLRTGRRVQRVTECSVVLDDDEQIPADLVLWATSAQAPPALSQLGLPTDSNGFLLTRSNLLTTADAPVFAVGDTGTIESSPTPKAGVYAVRQGPVLWKNIGHLLHNQPLISYRPQHRFLKLLNTGDGHAILEYHGISVRQKWCWKLKDAIDGRFMDKYQDYRPMEMSRIPLSETVAPMRCTGCGGKVAGSVLSRVLSRLNIPDSPHVLLGLGAPDDAAIVQPPEGRPMTVTVDFFSAPLDDPYLVGRIAALNAVSDTFAMGAKPLAALAMATIPLGRPRVQEQMLYELLAGSLAEFRQMDATLVGGHTIEGAQTTIGFTILADQGEGRPRTKDALRLGDQLVLTKPLGSGILLAAHMQARCRAGWMQKLKRVMLRSNQSAASLLDEFEITGVTDVTGFGLAGHLLEMLHAARLGAHLELERLPLLPGVEKLVGQGVQSTLSPANRAAESEIKVSEPARKSARYAVLFDPQTSGGLLCAVTPEHTDAMLDRLHELGDGEACVIGQVVAHSGDEPRLLVNMGPI